MPEHILVVENEEPMRHLIVSMLASAGYDCREAGDGLEALTLLDSGEEFELLLSNLMMDGEAPLAATKERFPDMPVVMIIDVSVALNAIRYGAYDYLLKPFDREQLLAVVRHTLEYRRLKLENRAYQTNLEALVTARTEQLRQAVTTLEYSYDISLQFLGDSLGLKDTETEGHSKRVTAFTISIARAMGLSADQIRVIARGAFLHDVGKIAIPDAILFKPGALTVSEMAVMHQHCVKGFEILKKAPFVAEAGEIVYAHQEKFDGTGYPRGLRGNEIPLGARIVAVANTLDAMTSDRPYRAAQSLAAAREEIRVWAGRQFDPDVVDVFLGMPENIWTDLRKDIGANV